jgi:general L-amino acid transport system substrate-binding protein
MNKRITTFAVALLIISVVYAACSGPAAAPAATPAPAQEVTATEPAAAPATEPAAAPAAEPAAEAAAPAAQSGGRLAAVIDRGVLICGVHGSLPGFGVVDASGEWAGFDADFCRAVAAAVLGDPTAIEFRPLSAQERFTAVQTGEVDVLFRNSTWTLTRDSSEVGMEWMPITFYDGQGMMVRKDSGIESLDDMDGATICVQSGTTTELNLADVFRSLGVDFEPVVFEEADATRDAYDQGRCDGVTTDKSQLVSYLTQLAAPDEHQILDVTMSKEPLAGAVAQGDPEWADAVRWIIFGLMNAEEYEVTGANIDEMKGSDDPNIRRLLGVEGDMGAKLGLSNDFIVDALGAVGNYGEIYNRNLGPDTPFNLPRGQNAQYTQGGLIYAPPIR